MVEEKATPGYLGFLKWCILALCFVMHGVYLQWSLISEFQSKYIKHMYAKRDDRIPDRKTVFLHMANAYLIGLCLSGIDRTTKL